MTLGRWLSLSESWSPHLKIREVIYYINYYPLIGATDSFKDLIKIAGPLFEAGHFEMHITSRFTDLLMETLVLDGILMSCPVTHFSNPVPSRLESAGGAVFAPSIPKSLLGLNSA